MFNDGPRFLRQAAAAGASDWVTVFSESYHPLYALATAGAAVSGASLEDAGAWVSILAGSAAVPVFYWLLRETFGSPCDALGALLFALHSRAIEFTADIQSEGIYLLFYVSALLLGWRALRSGRAWAFALTGLFAGIAYWARPEGLAVVVIVALLVLARALRGELRPRSALVALLALGSTSSLCIVPYVYAVYDATGTVTITQKKALTDDEATLSRDAGVPPLARLVSRERSSTASALRDFEKSARSSLRPTLLVALMLGFWFSRRDPPGFRAVFFATLGGIFALILLALVLRSGYISRRHLFPVLLPFFGYAALGLLALRTHFAVWFASRSRFLALLARPAPALFGLVALLLLPHQLEAKRLDKLAERRAAEWLAANAGPGRVAGVGGRVGYYAKRPMLDVGGVAPEALADALNENGVWYVVFDKEEEIGALDADARYSRIHATSHAGETAVVFAVSRTPGGR